jgi:ubiquinone/menaquinone biosynthesis C-methylase UbiE
LAGRGPVADLGAGTGHLAIPLARRGLQVAAVEPARAMLNAIDPVAGVEKIHASAEETTLSSSEFNLVLIADALHWVDPELTGHEAARLLRRGGVCAIVEARLATTPFLDALSRLVTSLNPKAAAAARTAGQQVLALATDGGKVTAEKLVHEVTLDDSSLEAVLRSLSYVGPALGSDALATLIQKAHALAREHGGALWRRTLHLSWARS